MAHTTHTKPAEVTKAQTPPAATPAPAAVPTPAQPNTATKQASASIFAKIKDKVTHVTPEQVDAWQKNWLAMPETRKKYEHLQDAPKVVGEELVAMSNDIIDYIQGQTGGKSEVFKKIKNLFTHPFDFLKPKTPVAAPQAPAKPEETKVVVETKPAPAQAKAEEVKAVAKKPHTKAKKTVKRATKK